MMLIVRLYTSEILLTLSTAIEHTVYCLLHKSINKQLKALWAALQADPVGVSARFGAPPAALIAELEEEVKKMEAAEAAIARAERLKGTAPEQKVCVSQTLPHTDA
jgi:hypothetical protein